MWIILKFDKKKLNLMKMIFKKNFGGKYKIYSPKICLENFRKNKVVKKEVNLLGDYLFCYHDSFRNLSNLKRINSFRGLKYYLSGFMESQNEILDFINKCKLSENSDGFVSNTFCDLKINNNYKFISGPLTNQIFKLVELQKNRINILLGNLKSSVIKKDFLFKPA